MGDATRVHTRAFSPRMERSHVLSSAYWLTPRDEQICLDLHDYRVLTTTQISEIHFAGSRRARRRLLILSDQGFIDRFRPNRYRGSAPWHYILGNLGIRVVSSKLELDVKALRRRMERDLALVNSPRLSHLVEANDFFVQLVKRCRQVPGYELTQWWGERRCAAELVTRARPDGLGCISSHGRTCTFALELDRGTERGDRLRHKVLSYGRLARRKEAPDALVFLFPSEKRERYAQPKLRVNLDIRVVTSHRELFYADPLGPVWRPVGFDRRVSLPQLGRGMRNEP
jgi:hypothetical protein